MELTEMLRQYRDMKAELKPMQDTLAALGKRIKEHTKETGEVGAVDGMAVEFRSAYRRHTWNTDKLMGYSELHPEVLNFVTVTDVAQAVALVPRRLPREEKQDG